MKLSEFALKLVTSQGLLTRKLFLLVDNTFNDKAELTDSFALFEYMQSLPEYQKISYYIINKKNVQYKQIAAKYPNNIIPVKHGKLNWKLLWKLAMAKYWLDSFQVISAFDPHAYIRKGCITSVYLQHGINFLKTGFIGDISISPKYFNKIIFSNEQEKKLYKKYYGYNDENTLMAGLSRWDLIRTDMVEKSIFIYFTSRAYIRYLNSEKVLQTSYYRKIYELLTSKQFHAFLEKHNIKVYAGIHHEMINSLSVQKALQHINFVDDKDIGAIKQRASMLITDFSSMCFDFMIKDKPVIFYRVDAGDELCRMSADSYENDRNVEAKNKDLYNIYYQMHDVLSAVKFYIENNFDLEDDKKKINKKFFTYRSDIRNHLIENLLDSPVGIANEMYPTDFSYLEPIKLDTKVDLLCCYTSGLAAPENWGQWSNGEECFMAFKLPNRKVVEVNIDCCAYVNNKHKKLQVSLYINNNKKADWIFKCPQAQKVQTIIINPDELDKDNVCRLFFAVHNPVSPKRLGMSNDIRKLGIGFKSITFTELDDIKK